MHSFVRNKRVMYTSLSPAHLYTFRSCTFPFLAWMASISTPFRLMTQVLLFSQCGQNVIILISKIKFGHVTPLMKVFRRQFSDFTAQSSGVIIGQILTHSQRYRFDSALRPRDCVLTSTSEGSESSTAIVAPPILLVQLRSLGVALLLSTSHLLHSPLGHLWLHQQPSCDDSRLYSFSHPSIFQPGVAFHSSSCPFCEALPGHPRWTWCFLHCIPYFTPQSPFSYSTIHTCNNFFTCTL